MPVGLKTYRIQNRVTEEWWQGEAPSAQEACELAGWLIGDCWVREFSPVRRDASHDSGYKYAGWKNVTKRGG